MVSIQYGGGPSLEQRQAFCNPPSGSHIPGYTGFVPSAKFQSGMTFGQETNVVAKKLPYYSGPKVATIKHIYPTLGRSKDSNIRSIFKDEVVQNRLPIPTGDNKYTEKMIPGYSGDIPHWTYKFGSTYRKLCDEAVNEFIVDYERNQSKMKDVQKMSNMFPKLRAICGNLRVRDHMNLWSNKLMMSSSLAMQQRDFLEAPIPGYTGCIPRQTTTELGLGARYHVASSKGLESFKIENKKHFQLLEHSMDTKNNIYTVKDRKPLTVTVPSEPLYTKRIFTQDGMVPQYTGHIHGAKSIDGYTFCNVNRMLDVCEHSFPCYGDFMRNMDLAV